MTDKKKIADWERIEFDFRAGIMSLREIAAAHGITEGAIRKRAKRDGWERDLGVKIQAKAESLVRKELVRNEVRSSGAYQATEREIVEVNAQMQADVILAHRTDITRGRKLSMSLLAELEMQTGSAEDFEKLGVLMAAPDEKGMDKLNEMYRKVISTPGRIDSVKKISETLKNLIALEREAFGLDAAKPLTPGDALDNLLTALDGRTASLIPK